MQLFAKSFKTLFCLSDSATQSMHYIFLVVCFSLPLLGFGAQEACTTIRGASTCAMLHHSISDKLNVEDLDSSARNFFKQLEGVSLPSPLCNDVFRATMCTILMPPCNATEFAVGDYRHQKPCKFLELYLAKTCGLRLPVGDLTFGEAPDCFVPNILQEPLCSASAAAASGSPPKTKAPPKSPKSKPSKPPKVNFAHLVQDWEVAASLVEGESGGQRQNDDVGEVHSAAASKGPQATKGSAATSSCGNRDSLQYGALAEVARALDSLGAAEHAHFVYLQALLSSSVSQLPASVDIVRRVFSLMHGAVEGAATSDALVGVHVHAANATLRKCLSKHSGLVDDVAASTFISEEAKVKELRKLQQRFDLDAFVETGTYFGVTLGGLIGDFERLISVEISKSLHDANTKKFQGQKHVTLLQGDSRSMLPKIIQELPADARSLFWLDGHFSGSKFETSRIDIDSPVISELHTVLSLSNSVNSVIAIDDARMFLGHHNCSGTFRSECYPKISQVAHVVCVHKPDWNIEISGDMIKILPPLKGSKGSAERKKTGKSDSDKVPTAAPSSDSANSFHVKASGKSVPKTPPSATKKTGQQGAVPPPKQKAGAVPPPKQKVSPKVQVAAAIPEESDSKTSHASKGQVPPPKKKNQGPTKATPAKDASQLSAEDAYDYEL